MRNYFDENGDFDCKEFEMHIDELAELIPISEISIVPDRVYDLEDCAYIKNPAPIRIGAIKEGIRILEDGNHRVSKAFHEGEEFILAWRMDLSIEEEEAIEKYFSY